MADSTAFLRSPVFFYVFFGREFASPAVVENIYF
jgi:hypothetical protein